MRLVKAFLSSFTFVAFSNAEAFRYSSGWSPGQATKLVPSPSATTSVQPRGFSWSSILTSGPIGDLLSRSGINMTERLAEAEHTVNKSPWDDRIPMIRDDNFENLIFNEAFATPEEAEARVWFVVVTTTSHQKTGLSALVDQHFDEAYNISVSENDLRHIRWGRVDYLNVTRLTTKWGIWRAPVFVIAKHQGKTLRFFFPQQLGVDGSILHTFLVEEAWKTTQPWSGPWAPGGSREELLDKFAVVQEKLYFYMTKIPYWMYLILSGGMGTLLINIFHRKEPTTRNPVTIQSKPTLATTSVHEKATVVPDNSSNVESKRGSKQRRKASKK